MNAPVHALTSRLSDEDIERLHDLLERRAVPHDGMSLEMLDGFLSALVVGPELVMPSEYFPCIWNHEVVWDSDEEAEEAYRLINKLWNDIVYRVNLDLPDDDDDSEEAIDRMEEAMPLLAMPETEGDEDDEDPLAGIDPDFPAAVAWAFGFMQGVSLRAEAWTRWENDDDHIAADLQTVAELTVLDAEHAEQMGMEREDVPDFAVRMSIAGSLPVILQNFNLYRMEQLGTRPVQREDLPERNDLCPCGSGRKFKKCCGDPARLN